MKKFITVFLVVLFVLSFSGVVSAEGDKNQIKNPSISQDAPSYGELNPEPYQENR